MKRCIVFAGGPAADYDRVTLDLRPDDYMIACDAGYLAAQHFAVTPHLVVGDFDSFHGAIDPSIEVLTVPAKKNDTDTGLGVKQGLARGCDEFVIVGGFGGRLDHTLANLQLLGWLCEQGARGTMLSNNNRAWAIRDGAITLPRLAGHFLSVFAWGGVCTGVNLEQLAYPLRNHTLAPTFSLGVSNEFIDAEARVSVEHGTLLIVASYEKGGF